MHKKDKQFNSFAQTRMSLVTIASLIMVGLFLLFFFKVGGNLAYIFSNQGPQNALEVEKIVNELYFLEGVPQGEAFHRSIPLTDKDLFLFFSAGNGPIFLNGKNGFEHHEFIFLRPVVDACSGKACVCHCGAGPYWKTTGDDIYYFLRSNEPYACPDEYLTCQTTNEEMLQFGNSRGHIQFKDAVLDKTKDVNSDNARYYPIPFDVILLGQEGSSYNAFELFFQRNRASKAYNTFSQASSIVTHLLDNYAWAGGVVIGGTGTPNIKKDRLEAVSVTLRMERANDLVYGICLHEQCFFESQNQQEVQAEIFSLAQFYLEEQQQKSSTAIRQLSADCLSNDLSEEERNACQETIFDIGFFAEPQANDELIILDNVAQQLVLWSFQHIYLLEFTSLENDRWQITPQLLVTSSCENTDFLNLVKKEPLTLRLPITFSNSETPETFFMLHKDKSEDSVHFYISTQGIEDMCESIQSFEEPISDPANNIFPSPDEYPAAINYVKLFSELFTAELVYDAELVQLEFTPATTSSVAASD
jgi:hypothetical protein